MSDNRYSGLEDSLPDRLGKIDAQLRHADILLTATIKGDARRLHFKRVALEHLRTARTLLERSQAVHIA
jgi:hypothetical protein